MGTHGGGSSIMSGADRPAAPVEQPAPAPAPTTPK
jgi:hypothetical protein